MEIQHILSDSLFETLRERQIIHSDPDIMGGTPVFIGTRVPVQTLFDYMEGEEGLSEFLADFPHLQVQAFQALETITRVVLNRGKTLNARSA